MNGFTVLMFIFGVAIFITGLYMWSGHQIYMRQSTYKKMDKKQLKYAGKVLFCSGFAPIIASIVSIFTGESIIPVFIMILCFIIIIYFSVKKFKEK